MADRHPHREHEHLVIHRHDTGVDNSVHQDIGQDIDTARDEHDWGGRDWDDWRHGGEFHQIIDNDPVVTSGHGSVAAGGDVWDSAVTSGDTNVVGYGDEAVTGDDSTTAYGTGAATVADVHDLGVGDGGAVSLTDAAYADNTDVDTRTAAHNSGSGSTAVNSAGGYGNATQYVDQHEADTSYHSHYQADTETDSHLQENAHNSGEFSDSHDIAIHPYY